MLYNMELIVSDEWNWEWIQLFHLFNFRFYLISGFRSLELNLQRL